MSLTSPVYTYLHAGTGLCTSFNKFYLLSPVENQNDLELEFKVFFFADSCCSDIVLDESN